MCLQFVFSIEDYYNYVVTVNNYEVSVILSMFFSGAPNPGKDKHILVENPLSSMLIDNVFSVQSLFQ